MRLSLLAGALFALPLLSFAGPIELEPGDSVKVNCRKTPRKRVSISCVQAEPTPTATPQPTPTITATPTPIPLPAIGVYVSRFVEYGRTHCDFLKSSAGNEQKLAATYYDAAFVYFQAADYFQDVYWLGCANAAISVYRDYYVRPNNGNVPGYWNFSHGLAEDCIRNSSADSCSAVSMLANNAAFARDSTSENTSDPQYSREVAYAIHSYLQAERLGAPRRARLSRLVNDALSHIDAWFVSRSAPYVRPFMVGLTAHALMSYHRTTPDPRIIPALRIAADGMFPAMWLPSSGAFKYTDRPTSSGGEEPAPDLNQLVSPLYFFLARETGLQAYREAGERIFAGGVAGAWLGTPGNGKQFNQNYRWGFEILRGQS